MGLTGYPTGLVSRGCLMEVWERRGFSVLSSDSTEFWIIGVKTWFFGIWRMDKMVKEIDRSKQQILGGVLVKNLKELIEARNNEKNQGTKKIYRETAPGPNTKIEVKIEKTRMGLRVYGKGADRNKLVVHTIHSPENHSNSPKEQVPLDEEV